MVVLFYKLSFTESHCWVASRSPPSLKIEDTVATSHISADSTNLVMCWTLRELTVDTATTVGWLSSCRYLAVDIS